jgi:hypothetical protein
LDFLPANCLDEASIPSFEEMPTQLVIALGSNIRDILHIVEWIDFVASPDG